MNGKKIILNPILLMHPEINSASSLINLNQRVFLCCDDQYGLYELSPEGKWTHFIWDLAPELPIEHLELKKVKPDFEALLHSAIDQDTLFLIPSGSKLNRTKVLSFDLNSQQFKVQDFSILYKDLFTRASEVNIEGAVKFGDEYLFLNRGVQSQLSSIVSVNSKTLMIDSITDIDFGSIEMTYLHGSELSLFEGALYALAVAEATANSYDDGEIRGSSLVKLSLEPSEKFKVLEQWIFDRPVKLEGLCRWDNKWLVATDPDGNGLSEFYTFHF